MPRFRAPDFVIASRAGRRRAPLGARALATACVLVALPLQLSALPPAATPVSAAREGIVDDGFTWFEAHNTETLDQKQAPVSTGWTLKSWVRVIGDFPNRSALKFVLSKAGKDISTVRCETSQYRKGPRDVDESFMWTVECWRGDRATKEMGAIDVKVYTVNGDTDEEKLVRTYHLDVRRVERVRGSTTNPEPDAPQYYIARHSEAAASWIYLRPSGYVDYFDYGDGPERSGANLVEAYFNLSPSEVGLDLPHGYARCSVNGKRLSMPGPMPYADQAISRMKRSYRVIHTDRLAASYKTGSPYQDEVGFRMVKLTLPLTWGKVRQDNRLALEDHPGDWECSLMNNGEVWRTWRWKVGTDGRLVPHPEQQGNIALNFGSTLVDMVIPEGGSPLDKRLVPEAAAAGAFYGQPWTSAEGKAMAGRVPRKGRPYPVPSTQAK
ncbi:MAG: hypothetical protein IPN16_16845 [Gemmatimonadetes bacterium]|nr:hypothetical protein [Gemmatimonadota bacterium]